MKKAIVIVMLILAMGLVGCPHHYDRPDYDRNDRGHDRGHDYEHHDRDNPDHEQEHEHHR